MKKDKTRKVNIRLMETCTAVFTTDITEEEYEKLQDGYTPDEVLDNFWEDAIQIMDKFGEPNGMSCELIEEEL